MRTPDRRRAFTLIELLTVIAIIAILAAITIPSIGAARNSANRARTKAQLSQWVAALELFRQEYGFYPAVAPGGVIDPDLFAAALTGRALQGGPASDLAGNTKRLVFYSLAAEEISEDGQDLVDAFGNTEFGLRFDTDRNGVIDDGDSGSWANLTSFEGESLSPLAADESVAGGVLRARVAAYSPGRGRDAEDMVLSWR